MAHPERTGPLVLAVGLAFSLLAGAATADPGERGYAKKHGTVQANAGQRVGQVRRASGERAERRHGMPGAAVECGDVLSEAGNYSLNSDLVCTTPIQITGSNVHLDLAGHSISCDTDNWAPTEEFLIYYKPAIFTNYDGYVAIYTDGAAPEEVPALTGISVRNGRIARCGVGIFLAKSDRARVMNVHLDGNNAEISEDFPMGLAGILTDNANHSDFTDNLFSGGFRGIELESSNNNRIRRNRVEGNAEDGIGLYGSSDNVVQRNVVTGNLGGMWIQTHEGRDPSRNLISSNNLSDNRADGIGMIGVANDNVVWNNTLTGNARFGVLLFGVAPVGLPVPAGNTLRGNTAFGNSAVDLAEFDLDENYEPVIPAECSNRWEHNSFDTAIGPEMCIE